MQLVYSIYLADWVAFISSFQVILSIAFCIIWWSQQSSFDPSKQDIPSLNDLFSVFK